MVICTRIFEETMPNVWQKTDTIEMTPEEYQATCKESIETSDAPTWDRDKTYF